MNLTKNISLKDPTNIWIDFDFKENVQSKDVSVINFEVFNIRWFGKNKYF